MVKIAYKENSESTTVFVTDFDESNPVRAYIDVDTGKVAVHLDKGDIHPLLIGYVSPDMPNGQYADIAVDFQFNTLNGL